LFYFDSQCTVRSTAMRPNNTRAKCNQCSKSASDNEDRLAVNQMITNWLWRCDDESRWRTRSRVSFSLT